MRKNISRILLVASDPTHRVAALRALSRSAAQVISVRHNSEVREILKANPHQLPGLIITHLEQGNPEEAATFYRQIRNEPTTQSIPMIILADTSIELATVQRIATDGCFCAIAPLSYGLLVFALPSLEIEIEDSLLYENFSADSLARK